MIYFNSRRENLTSFHERSSHLFPSFFLTVASKISKRANTVVVLIGNLHSRLFLLLSLNLSSSVLQRTEGRRFSNDNRRWGWRRKSKPDSRSFFFGQRLLWTTYKKITHTQRHQPFNQGIQGISQPSFYLKDNLKDTFISLRVNERSDLHGCLKHTFDLGENSGFSTKDRFGCHLNLLILHIWLHISTAKMWAMMTWVRHHHAWSFLPGFRMS